MEEFKSWQVATLGETPSILWLRGGPGLGKSTIASYFIDHLPLRWPQSVVAYFLCKDGISGLTTVRDMIRTLAYQIILRSHGARSSLDTLKNSHFKIDCTIGIRFLFQKIIKEPLEKCKTEVYLVIDGLDEADDKSMDASERKTEMDIFVDCLTTLISVRVLLLSRPDSAVRNIASQIVIKSLETTQNANDILGFVTRKVATPENSHIRKFFPKELGDPCTYFTHKCQGMFLWASLALERVSKVNKKKVFQALLEEMSCSVGNIMDALYSSVLMRVENVDFEWVKEILLWLLAEDGLLSLDVLQEVVQSCLDDELDDFEKFLGEQCGSVVRIIRKPNAPPFVQFIHETFKSFLTNPDRCDQSWSMDKITVRTYAASKTLQCLCGETNPLQSVSQSRNAILVGYAGRSFIDHLKGIERYTQRCADIVIHLHTLFTSESLDLWVQFGLLPQLNPSQIKNLSVNFEEGAITSIQLWLRRYEGIRKPEQLEIWRGEVIMNAARLGEPIGKAAARLWRFCILATFEDIAACFLLALKYYCMSEGRRNSDFGECGEFIGPDFRGISAWIGVDRPVISKNIGVACAVLRRWSESRLWYVAAADETPALAEWLGDACFEEKDFRGAIDAYEKALARGGDSTHLTNRLNAAREAQAMQYHQPSIPNTERRFIIWQPPIYPSLTQSETGESQNTSPRETRTDVPPKQPAYEGKGDADAIISAFTTVLERAPENRIAAQQLAKAYERKGDHDAAISLLLTRLERDPNEWTAVEQLEEVYKRREDADAAILGWTALLDRDPSGWGLPELLGKAYERKGDVDAAISAFTAVLERAPDNRSAARQLAKAYEQKGDHDTAISLLVTLLEQDPNDWTAVEQLEEVYKRREDVDAAILGWTALVDRDPRSWRFLGYLGKAYERKGDVDAAISAFTAILERAPDSENAAEQLGNACERKGGLDATISVLITILDRNPYSEATAELLGRAYERKAM
jgi:tetratricopeptide (TPR) repeat protein